MTKSRMIGFHSVPRLAFSNPSFAILGLRGDLSTELSKHEEYWHQGMQPRCGEDIDTLNSDVMSNEIELEANDI